MQMIQNTTNTDDTDVLGKEVVMVRPGPVRTETAQLSEPGCAAGDGLLSSNRVKWGSPKERACGSGWSCTPRSPLLASQ